MEGARWRSCGRRRSRGMHGAASPVAAIGRSIGGGWVHLVWIHFCRPDLCRCRMKPLFLCEGVVNTARPYRTLIGKKEDRRHPVSAEEAAECVAELSFKKDGLVVCLNDYELSKSI